MSCDYLPPGTRDSDRDAPWNEVDHDGADVAHGIDMVCGGHIDSMLETFTEYLASVSDAPEPIISGTTWLRPNASGADLLKLMLSDDGTSKSVVLAALGELRARYLADKYTQRVIEKHADKWVLDRQEEMAEGSL